MEAMGVSGQGKTTIDDVLSSKDTTSSGIIHMKIGDGVIFDSAAKLAGGIIPKSFNYTTSKEFDSDGYPIFGTVSIDWESFVMATGDVV